MPSINRVEPYVALADVYRPAGLTAYSVDLVPNLLQLAFQIDWTGRTVVDLACGTGDVACWFGEQDFRVTGVDSSPAMIRQANATASAKGSSAEFVQGDMRTYQPIAEVEMVTCLGGSLNYVATLRDLESVIKQAHNALSPDKLFIFDLDTIQGLAEAGGTDQVIFDDNNIYIIARNTFNYDTLALSVQYDILRYIEGSGWQRAEEIHLLRGYPIQAVTALLSKNGFKLLRTLTPGLRDVENHRDIARLVFMAQRAA